MRHRNVYLLLIADGQAKAVLGGMGWLITNPPAGETFIVMHGHARQLPTGEWANVLELETHDPLDRHYNYPVHGTIGTLEQAMREGWREITREEIDAYRRGD